jgi:hypothetical protein
LQAEETFVRTIGYSAETEIDVKITAFRDVTPCNLVDCYQRLWYKIDKAGSCKMLGTFYRLHGVTSLKTAIFVVTDVRTSN